MNNMGSYSQGQWSEWAYNGSSSTFNGYAQLPSYATYLPESMEIYSAQQGHLVQHQQLSRANDPKPRLSKEEVEILEAEFQKNHKPNSSIKKALAEQMRVDNARINNWFQNRRAREKKEKNIREYAARQKLEKEQTAAEVGHFSDCDRYNDRVVSSAPFPDPRRPSIKTEVSEPSLSDLATPDHESETSHSDASSPYISAHATPDRALSFDPIDAKDYLSLGQQGFLQDSTNAFLSLSETNTHVQDNGLPFPGFNQFPQVIIMSNGEGEATPSFTQHCFPGTPGLSPNSVQDSYSQFSESDFDERNLEIDSQESLKSPPSMDIASRRNRRPPHLAIGASHSFSGCGPKTAGDLGRRSDLGGSMRRVASATSTVRVSKQSGTPRSPYYERNQEALFHLDRSPTFAPATATIAPPTPNTPVVSNQPDLSSAMPSNEKFSSDVLVHDPTLRTPPTTPGVMDQMFALNAGYDGPVADEPIVTPGLSAFSNDFEVPGMAGSIPQYVNNGCASQPQTPSYTTHMGPNYFGYSGGNAEYNWSDVSMSAKSSPGQSHRQVQFMNMTPSSFNGER